MLSRIVDKLVEGGSISYRVMQKKVSSSSVLPMVGYFFDVVFLAIPVKPNGLEFAPRPMNNGNADMFTNSL